MVRGSIFKRLPFRHANKDFAQLTFLFRVVNAGYSIAALANLVQVLVILKGHDTTLSPDLPEAILARLQFFNLQWRFMLVFFGIYMLMLGWLAVKSIYLPNLIALLICFAGTGYLIDNLIHFFYPDFNTGNLWFTYFGEIIFMFWLLVKGSRLKIDTLFLHAVLPGNFTPVGVRLFADKFSGRPVVIEQRVFCNSLCRCLNIASV